MINDFFQITVNTTHAETQGVMLECELVFNGMKYIYSSLYVHYTSKFL